MIVNFLWFGIYNLQLKIILTTLKDDFYLTWWNQSQNGNNPNPYNQFYWKPDKGSSVSEAIGFKILFNRLLAIPLFIKILL
ncbi:hypothetical protein [Spiroplasma poulsonii]|uniref:hypothetical protein n=1 Tax=Spiroplasma poulsonii TaxID=2138 RepID=UPI00058A22E5|nr:hypothetical protein [Spiroplasma poulsonii]